MSELTRPIRPEILAAKIEKIENFELPHLFDEFAAKPRLFRALWFLQWVSQPRNYAGGLSKFASDLIRANTERIGTAHSASVRATGNYKLSDAVQILREMPAIARERLLGKNAVIFEQAFLGDGDGRVARIEDFLAGDMALFREGNIARDRRKNRKDWEPLLLKGLTPEGLRRECTEQANERLASHLKALCELPHVGFHTDDAPWYFQDLGTALLEFIGKRAAEVRATKADTEIMQQVSHWILKSQSTRRAVTIIGNSRFGKTEAVELNAQMYPCSCRLVNTPATNGLGDLLREVAKSLGIEVLHANNSGRELRERIDYVLRFSHLQLIFDELQFLLPAAYSRNTAPARLNWIRRSIMDQNVAAVFVGTPQSYLPAKQRFVKTTGYAMEQFDERILKTVQLPIELSEQDLRAVARIHLGDLPEDDLSYVVGQVLAAERNFISDIEKVATLAKDNANEHGRKRPSLADIDDALADVLPAASPVVAEKPEKERQSRPVQQPCRAIEKGLPAARIDFRNSPNRGRGIRALKVPG